MIFYVEGCSTQSVELSYVDAKKVGILHLSTDIVINVVEMA